MGKKFTTYKPGRLSALSFIFLLLSLALSTTAVAQEEVAGLEDCAGGTYYLIAYPDTTSNTYDDRPCCRPQYIRTNTHSFTLYIYSPVDQTLEIGRINSAGQKVSISAGQILEYDTEEIGIPLITDLNTPKSNVLRVESKFPVVVYCYMMTPFGAEAFTAIPVEWWGNEYYAAAWPGEVLRDVYPAGEFNYTAVPKQGEAEILIIAAYDNTVVQINPTTPLRDCSGCRTVTLRAGEAYLVQSTTDVRPDVDQQPDLAGTLIQASKRIGVITGNPRVMHNKGVRPSLAENSFMNMAIEWIPPVEQHGTQFVFMPTWDDRRQSNGLPLEEARDQELVRVYATRPGTTEISWKNTLGQDVVAVGSPADPQEFAHEQIGFPQARSFATSQPGMAFMSPHAVVKFNGTTTFFNDYIGASYLSWSTYMVELVPREQWTSFAPLRTPSVPAGMKHYLNLVTDSANQFNVYFRQGVAPPQLFPFNRGIVPGTDLVWGSIPLNQGAEYYFEGDKGARFYGFAYGSARGQEQYRPGANRKKDDGKGSAMAGGGEEEEPEVLHPSEYEEDVALMYGFPLAPSRCVLAPPDEYEITVTQNCEVMEIRIVAKNNPASGIRSITMLPDSSENTRLDFLKPADPLELKSGKVTEAELRLSAINPQKDAHAVIVIRDRTRASKRWRVQYEWSAERVELSPDDILDFGKVTVNEAAGERVVTITNPLPRPVVIKKLDFTSQRDEFVITRTNPEFPNGNWKDGQDSITLEPGATLQVWIDITPRDENRTYEDSLRIRLGCITVTLPVKAATALPCIFVSDLDFGTMNVGESRTLQLKVCNQGDGEVRFDSPWLNWLENIASQLGFSVDPAETAKLHGRILQKNECVTLTVRFTASDKTGPFRTTARFWANTRACRDTSIWRANVVEPGPQIDPYNWNERWLSENDCTKNPEERYTAVIRARNAGTSEFEVVSLGIANDPDSVFSILSTPIAPGLVMRPSDAREIEVAFDPEQEKVYYNPPATIRLVYKVIVDGQEKTDSIENTLEGIGIESYVTITDQNFGRIQFTGTETVPSTVVIAAGGTRPVNLDQAGIDPAAEFVIDPAWITANTWAQAAGDNDILTLDASGIAGPKEITVDVIFTPQRLEPLDKRATIDLVGDFAYGFCSQTDSSGALDGQIYTLSAEAEGFDFGSILTCFDRDGFITLRNLGTDPVQITEMTQPTPAGQFILDPALVLPIVLASAGDPEGKDAVRIPVRFAPDATGTHSAQVTARVMNMEGTKEVALLTATLTGEARTISVNLSILRNYSQFPGLPLSIPVTLDNDPEEAQVTSFVLDLTYDEGMMLLDDVKLGDLFPTDQGWNLDILSRSPGKLKVRIYNVAGRVVRGTGTALVLEYITYIGSELESEIPFSVAPEEFGTNSNPCVAFTTSPGHARLDSICGLNFRLIELTANKYSAGSARPSVVRSTTDIEFSIGLDARTTVEVYNQNGDKVGVLVDRYLQPGAYSITWDASLLPSGKYFYRITSGHWSGTGEVIVRK